MIKPNTQLSKDLGTLVEATRVTASDVILSHLRTQIIRGDLHAGDVLHAETIAKEANVSRTPVREALYRLESEGLIRQVPRSGYVVCGLSRQDCLDVFEIRMILEPAAVELTTRRLTPEISRRLDASLEAMQKAVDTGDFDGLIDAHYDWTDALRQGCQNNRLKNLLEIYGEYVRRSSFAGLRAQGGNSVQIHREITEAIKAGYAVRARELFRSHLEFAYKVFLEHMPESE